MTNQYEKKEYFVIKSFKDISGNFLIFKAPVTIAFEEVTTKSKGVLYSL
jgi:hypothetical protein